jgi:hypothetical protein
MWACRHRPRAWLGAEANLTRASVTSDFAAIAAGEIGRDLVMSSADRAAEDFSYLESVDSGSGRLPPRAAFGSNDATMDLNGRWKFRLAAGLDDLVIGFQDVDFESASLDDIDVPSC